MRSRLAQYLLLGMIVLGTFPSPLRAQTQITTGVIRGTVLDSTGAALPGVTVEARQVATNFTTSAVTDAEGRYVLLQLPSGDYKVTFTADELQKLRAVFPQGVCDYSKPGANQQPLAGTYLRLPLTARPASTTTSRAQQ